MNLSTLSTFVHPPAESVRPPPGSLDQGGVDKRAGTGGFSRHLSTTDRKQPITMSTTKTNARPYPNVVPSRFKAGRWEARHPSNGKQVHLGTFDTPEDARRAVLIAQAEHLEAKAAAYRAEAAR